MRRVVVTGVGLVTGLGAGLAESWSGLACGRDGHRPVTLFPTAGYVTDVAAEIPDLPDPDVPRAFLRRLMRVDRIGLLAAAEAVEGARFAAAGVEPERVGVSFGAGASGLLEAQPVFAAREEGRRRPVRHHLGEIQSGTGRWIAWRHGFRGPRACPSTACSSSTTAIGIGADWIRRGVADAALVGGAESLSQLTFSGFNAVHALGPVPCRPFSAGREGMSLGEGGAALVLEERASALARGAPILAEVLSFATSLDGHHMTAPHPEGRGAALAIRRCLERAGVRPEDVDLVSAHGTGTAANDSAECIALRAAFGPAAEGLRVVSAKSAVGHCLGAAGAIECAAAVMALDEDTIPPNLRLEEPDPELAPLSFPTEARARAGLARVLKNSFAFGGSNAVVLLGRGDAA